MVRGDAHAHLFRAHDGGASTDDVELYRRLSEAHGIERTLVVGYEGEDWAAGNNAFLAQLSRNWPLVAPLKYQRCVHPPTSVGVHELAGDGFYGISVYVLSERDAAALVEWPLSTLRALALSRVIVSLNVSATYLPVLSGFLDSLDGSRVLLSHLGLPGVSSSWAGGSGIAALQPVLDAARFRCAGVKVSGLYAVSPTYPHIEAWPLLAALAERFGADRLYWGSDFPPALQHSSFEQTIDVVSHLGWSDADLDAVMGGNLLRLLDGDGSCRASTVR